MDDRFLILVVDDNEFNRFLLKELLARIPEIDIFEANSGTQALQLTIEHNFNLILLDVQMPEMDGYETARHLQTTARTRDIPIIFLTAVFKSEEFIKRGYAVGAVDYLTKPLDDNILLNRVRHYQHLKERETRLLNAMSEMRSMQDNLLQSEKLSSLGAMVAGISHELNTPLGNTKLALSTLLDRIADVKKQYQGGTLKRSTIEQFINESMEITTLANRSVDRALNLAVTFKQVAIDQTSERQRMFDLATVIHETITSLSPTYKHEPWTFVIDVPEGIQMDSYPGPLEQVLINLVQNSIRHGFEGRDHGRITIQARIEACATSQPDQVIITFSDDGIGIASQNLDKVFEPFFTTGLGRGGSGLGLHITRRIVTTLLGGSIELHSQVGLGTSFILKIARTVKTPSP